MCGSVQDFASLAAEYGSRGGMHGNGDPGGHDPADDRRADGAGKHDFGALSPGQHVDRGDAQVVDAPRSADVRQVAPGSLLDLVCAELDARGAAVGDEFEFVHRRHDGPVGQGEQLPRFEVHRAGGKDHGDGQQRDCAQADGQHQRLALFAPRGQAQPEQAAASQNGQPFGPRWRPR